MPAILMSTEPNWVGLLKTNVLKSSPPKPMSVVAGWPCTARPSFFPGGCEHIDPARATAIHVCGRVELQAIACAGLRTAALRKHAFGVFGERAVWEQIEGAIWPRQKSSIRVAL